MRIVGGKFKGRRLETPTNRDVRPTSDRTREAVFNILAHAPFAPTLTDVSVVDVFAGTGALGLEALSRGAKCVTFVDADNQSVGLIKKNAGTFGALRDVTILKLDATLLPPPPRAASCPAGVIFIDAPYGQGLTLKALLSLKQKGWLNVDTLLVIEVANDEEFELPVTFTALDERRYGKAKVLFAQLRISPTAK